ncbi:MAG: HSP90 family protein [Planctomycetota bacterium]
MSHESNEHHFQVDLRGVIDLLSDHLYSGPQVYIREVLQNAVDAIVARRQLQPDHVGSIRLELVTAEGAPPTLVIHDDGIGLTSDEVHQFLATIGQSSKRDQLTGDDFIGQFGVGLLSGFVVSEEIVVITRSIQPDAATVQWKGRADGTYTLGQLELDAEPGTQVYLRAKPGCQDFFDADFIRETARHFGSHLPIDVQVWSKQDRTLINSVPPWRSHYANEASRTELSLEYGKNAFDIDFLDAIPLRSNAGGVDGIAFILPFSSTMKTQNKHRVYIKDMLLSDSAEGLLPDWAFFVRCVINSTTLRPLASREGLYDDQTLAETRDDLGACLRRYLVELSQQDPNRLQRLIHVHYLPMKALAAEDDEFFKMVIDWLPFETSLGTMTMGEYNERFGTVRYVRTRDRFRQMSSVAAAQKMCVVNGCYTFDTALIEKLPHVTNRDIEFLDANEWTENLDELDLQERETAFEFVRTANVVLQTYGCSAEIKKFQPHNLPALYTTNESADFMRSVDQAKEAGDEMWGGILDAISGQAGASAQSQLCFNLENPVIKKLVQVEDRDLQRRSIETLYVQSLLLGHYPLKDREMNLLGDGLLGWIELCLNQRGSARE